MSTSGIWRSVQELGLNLIKPVRFINEAVAAIFCDVLIQAKSGAVINA